MGVTRKETDDRILGLLDIKSEYSAMGLEITGTSPTSEGWLECRAFGRCDRNPSAGINIKTGRYKNFSSDENLSLWDFAEKYAGHESWQMARRFFADKVGVHLAGKKSGPTSNLTFLKWSRPTVALWCRSKPPITPEAILASGGQIARYRGQFLVLALPVHGPELLDKPPIGQVLWNTSGEDLPIFSGQKGEPPTWKKMKSTAGSKSGWIGPVELLENAEVVWKTEGPGDMLALNAAIPPSMFGRHIAITNAGGAGEWIAERTLKLLEGKKVMVVHDADQPGQKGAEKQAGAIARHALEVRSLLLPYKIDKKHGKDLRDFLLDGHDFADLVAIAKESDPVAAAEATADPLLAVDDPFRLARLYIKKHESDDDGKRKLVFYGDAWYRWDGTCYRQTPDSDVRLRITATIQEEMERLANEAADRAKDGKAEAIKVSRRLIGDATEAAKATCHFESHHEQPCWLDGKGPWPAKEVFATSSGLLHLPSFVDGEDPYLVEPTLNFFSPNGVDYPFDIEAQMPDRWIRFLEDLWGNDQQSIEMLQEWFGYCLLPETRHHKMLMIVGPKRSGKGTIGRVLTRLVGQRNIVGPKLASLGTQFGSAPLIGKTVAIVADARLSGRADAHAIVENLLSISGEDCQTIDRKNREAWSGTLSTRFTIFSNELPNFRDAAGAIASRIVLLRTIESFYGREDKGLDEALQREMSGILLWAIEGYARLKHRGYFIEPESSQELLDDLNRLASPVTSFVETNCDISPAHETAIDDLYTAWKEWCKTEGIDHPGSKSSFGRQLRAACPSIRTIQKRESNGNRSRSYEGIGLLSDYANDPAGFGPYG